MQSIDWALVALLLGVGVAISFGLAAMGEPTSLWLWRDVVGAV